MSTGSDSREQGSLPERALAGGERTGIETAAVRFHGVSKHFPGASAPAVATLDLAIPRGSIVALIGPSGCGKTTTLRMMNRLIEPTAGRIEIGGADVTELAVTELRRGIGYVIQEVGLFPHRTIAANIATVPKVLGWSRARISARIDELIQLIGLDPAMLQRYPDELSGGQQQRVGVARALAADPPILLMDEPFGAVDPIVRARLQDELLELQANVQKTIVLVTHDLDEAIKLADRIALMNVGGVLEQFASPDELLRSPANEFVERFVGDDRSIRRLGLATVDDLPLRQGPVVEITASPPEAAAAMTEHRTSWVGVTAGDRFRGWIHLDAIEAGIPLTDASCALPDQTLGPDSTWRAALQVILSSPVGMAVVEDQGRFVGLVTIEQLRGGLTHPDGELDP